MLGSQTLCQAFSSRYVTTPPVSSVPRLRFTFQCRAWCTETLHSLSKVTLLSDRVRIPHAGGSVSSLKEYSTVSKYLGIPCSSAILNLGVVLVLVKEFVWKWHIPLSIKSFLRASPGTAMHLSSFWETMRLQMKACSVSLDLNKKTVASRISANLRWTHRIKTLMVLSHKEFFLFITAIWHRLFQVIWHEAINCLDVQYIECTCLFQSAFTILLVDAYIR